MSSTELIARNVLIQFMYKIDGEEYIYDLNDTEKTYDFYKL